MSAFVALFLPVTLTLGAWQLARAAEKVKLEEAFLARQGELPVAADDVAMLAPFTRVRLRGRYDAERYFLLDNRTLDGHVGYDVIALFLAADGKTYFVNRGFVFGGARRDALPTVAVPTDDVTITGMIWRDDRAGFELPESAYSGHWPERIEKVDLARMIDRAGAGERAEIRIEPGAPGALSARFDAPNFSPETNYGYAVQWFGLAIALVVLFVVFARHGGR
jgi:surfeit locus 1 family protein